MKKLKAKIDRYFDRLDERWRALPLGKQHKYTIYFFMGYMLLTVGVVLKVWNNNEKSENNGVIEHIENPVPQVKKSSESERDTVSTILKNRNYERK